jgi:hypothetical protein
MLYSSLVRSQGLFTLNNRFKRVRVTLGAVKNREKMPRCHVPNSYFLWIYFKSFSCLSQAENFPDTVAQYSM